MPNDKLPGQGISAHWDWSSCHFYCHLQHKWAAMPISLNSCWHLPPKGALGESTSRLTPAEGLAQLPASPFWGRCASSQDDWSQRTVLDQGKAWSELFGTFWAAEGGIFWLICVLTVCSNNSEDFPQSKCSHYLLAGTSEYSPISFNILPVCDQKSFQKWFYFKIHGKRTANS